MLQHTSLCVVNCEILSQYLRTLDLLKIIEERDFEGFVGEPEPSTDLWLKTLSLFQSW